MTGTSRCQGRMTTIDTGTEEKRCPAMMLTPAENIPAPVTFPENLESVQLSIDLYSQAFKALSERSPFDSIEVLATTVPTLPRGLASLLSKHSDGRKKHKRPHSDTKSSRKGSTEKSKSSNVWVELEDYFRELTLQDIERLHRLSSLSGSLAGCNTCSRIPIVGNALNNDDKVDSVRADVVKVELEEARVTDVPCNDSGALEVKEELVKTDDETRDSLGIVEQGPVPPQSCSSVEWVLASRNRVLLTTTRPTKKRKLLGETAGLERLIVAQPCGGSSKLCHVCSMGDTGDQLNQLVVCKCCNVVVHQKCYGVQGEIDKSWLCSWCKQNIDTEAGQVLGKDRPCLFCPESGGALKPFQRVGGGNGGSVEFAHLFCSQWMPEVYIDDSRLMEPLLRPDEIKDTRGKLVCNLCKVKLGSCVRCSDGSCRTSFHPICAREARNKLEIWGKFGCDDIELRAFCAKHSGGKVADGGGTLEKNDQNNAVVNDSLATSNRPTVLSVNKMKKLKIGCKNGDKVTFHIGAADSNANHMGESESQEVGSKDVNSNSKLNSGSSDGQELSNVEILEKNLSEDIKKSYLLDLGLVLKKLVDRGKVSLEQLASEIGISADSLASRVTDNHLGPELHCKILKWLRDHACMDASQKDLRANVSCLIAPETKLGAHDSSDAVSLLDSDMPDAVPVKSVPPRRRTLGNIRILKDKVISLWKDKLIGNGVSINKGTSQEHVNDDRDKLSNDLVSESIEKTMVESIGFEDAPAEPSPTSASTLPKSNSLCDVECNGTEEGTSSGKSSLLDLDQEIPSCASVGTAGHCIGDVKPGTDFVHPYIQKKLEEVESWLIRSDPHEFPGNFTPMERSTKVDVCFNDKKPPVCTIEIERDSGVNMDDLHKAKEIGVLDLFPDNEVDGEIVFFQQRLLSNAVALKHNTDQLVCKVVRNLPHEMDSVRKERWDDVLANQYIYELKEARKQGRKERRHKEAQAVLAAATAAAAASSRMSALRKDAADESQPLEIHLKVESSRVRGALTSLSVPRTKETNSSSLALPKTKSDGYSDIFQFSSGSPKEHRRSCDVCSRSENILNPMLICSFCKVAVHSNCYRRVKESTGPWYCELCEELSLSKVSRSAIANSSEEPFPVTECGLCGASEGAFRKSSNGQWIHAFCAEWIFDSTFKRGQVCPVEGMETVLKGNDICSVCHRKYGVCLKCNYGNCQATFHPPCARSAGYYMSVRNIGGGKMQRKAYCSKHSMEQRAKAETQKHGVEDLKVAKQHRVELEKLRLLCERIVKREKLKRELILCSHEILASKRDSMALSRLVHRPLSSHEFTSESATTSLKGGHVEVSRSCSEAIQKSDNATVDSALSAKRCTRLPLSIDNDQRTDDSSTSQHIPTPTPTDRVSFAGKQLPIRATMACRNFPPGAEKRIKSRKHSETFEKELIMTSDQACKKNRRLPKGYIYVPIDRLSSGKQVSRGSVEREELDG